MRAGATTATDLPSPSTRKSRGYEKRPQQVELLLNRKRPEVQHWIAIDVGCEVVRRLMDERQLATYMNAARNRPSASSISGRSGDRSYTEAVTNRVKHAAGRIRRTRRE